MKMKTSLKKLREFGLHKGAKDQAQRRRIEHSQAQLDEITRASQDMLDMKECYDSLLSSAAATANSAYEFSESLKEMGACLLQKTALNEDEDSGKVLLMLGKLQFELQGLMDKYRSHLFQTITVPSESLLNEIRTVEEMKKQCDEKRSSYENMMTIRQDKKRSKSSKGETFSSQQVKAAREEYDQEATLFVFRLKSLKQGQSRSLLTQAARHHASQLCFFKKALLCVESIEPHVQRVTEQNHIDYRFSGLEDDTNDDDDTNYDDDGDSYSSNDTDDEDYRYGDGELSFEYREKEPMGNVSSTPSSSTEEKLNKRSTTNAFALARELKASSQSAPLSAEKNFDTNKRLRELQSLNSRKFHSYVLPTPTERKSPIPRRPSTQPLEPTRSSLTGIALNYRHSSPMEQLKYSRSMRNDKSSSPILRSRSPVLRERNENKLNNLPPSKSEEIPLQAYDRYATYDDDRSRRLSFSGPLIGMAPTSRLGIYCSGSIASMAQAKVYSRNTSHSRPPRPSSLSPPPRPSSLSPPPRPSSLSPPPRPSSLSRPPRPSSLSPQRSPSASPPIISSPKISELHELPRPPRHSGLSCPLPPPPVQLPQQMLAL